MQQRKHHGRIEHGLLRESKDDGLFGRIDLADADGGALDAQTMNSQKRLCGRHGHPEAIREIVGALAELFESLGGGQLLVERQTRADVGHVVVG